MKYIIFIVIFGAVSTNCYSELLNIDTLPSYSVYAAYNLNYHYASFNKLKNIPNCCPDFDYGLGNGFNAGLSYSYPLSEYLRMNMRLGYLTLDAQLRKLEPTKVIIDGDIADGEFEHIINSKISNIGFEPSVSWKFYKDLSLTFGIRLSYSIENKYDQYEKIIKPDGRATFMDSLGNPSESIFRNQNSGDLPDANSLGLYIPIGISYDLPMNREKTLIISPEIVLIPGLTKLVKDLDWTANAISFGFSIKYVPLPKPDIDENYERFEQIDTLTIKSYDITDNKFIKGKIETIYDTISGLNLITYVEKSYRTDTLIQAVDYILKGDVFLRGINSKGLEIEIKDLNIEEFLSTKMYSLLNYVFFDENSYKIPDRYKLISNEGTKQFDINNLYNSSTLDVYYQILNIIGSRLHEYPEAKLTLTGCNNNSDLEKLDAGLSANRAETIGEYLTKIWGINRDRIIIQSRDLPNQPSNLNTPEGMEENRRVEILSDEMKILAPIVVNDTLRKLRNGNNKDIYETNGGFKGIIIKPVISPEVNLEEFRIGISNNSVIIKEFVQSGYAPKSLEWDIYNEKEAINMLQDSIFIELYAQDYKNNSLKIKKPFMVGKKTLNSKKARKEGDIKIDNYSLILFEFGSDNLSEWNKEIPNIIKPFFDDNSIIKVTGYSDRVGNSDYNLKLSEQRAKAVANLLNHPNISYSGVGETILLYNNDLPEGRFYCRTVDIVVETPIKW